MFEAITNSSGVKILASVQEEDAHLKSVFDALKELESLQVLVGIPEEESSRPKDGENINNAELLYIHTNGSPGRRIPPRPVIEPAIEDGREVIGQLLAEASEKALEGNKQGMRQALEKAGMQGQNMARDWFTNPKNGWPPLKESAVYNREKKMSKKKLEEAKAAGKQHMPLIDTGEMRKSISYVVREK